MKSPSITPAERVRGQRSALLANLFSGLQGAIVLGPLMMLFANDVLDFSGKKIAGILALAPLATVLRLPLAGSAHRFGKVRTARAATGVMALMVVFLLLLPSNRLSFPLFLAVLLVYFTANQFIVMVWQPLLRDVTTVEDRGWFFARMRFCFTVLTTMMMFLIPLLVGVSITESQYKILLGVALFGLFFRWFWLGRIPENPAPPRDRSECFSVIVRRLWGILRTSPLFRLPLVTGILQTFLMVQIFTVYLKRLLEIPSDLVSLRIAFGTLGSGASLLLWGKIADIVGFRSMRSGLSLIGVGLCPLLLLIAPFPAGESGRAAIGQAWDLSLIAMLLHGFLLGAVVAGEGIARTSIEHYFVKQHESVEAMNLYYTILLGGTSLTALFLGFLLDEVAIPVGSLAFAGGWLHFDWIKGYFFLVFVPVELLILILMRRIPDHRPHFGLTDFFFALSPASLRGLFFQQHVFAEAEEAREKTARWFAANPSPVGIQPLRELLTDPSYDVKVHAIRALGGSNSELAGQTLLAMLDNPRHQQVADHLAWALGELRYAPAYPVLVARLAPVYGARIRAMAARALGKIGDSQAAVELAAILREPDAGQHLLSSVARGLLRLGAAEHAEAVLGVLDRLDEREERFELMDACCGLLDVPNQWILRRQPEERPYEALRSFIGQQTATWQKTRKATIRALESRNHVALRTAFRQARTPMSAHPTAMLAALEKHLAQSERFDGAAFLGAAWLLLRRDVDAPG